MYKWAVIVHIHCVLCVTKSPTLIRPFWGTSPLCIHLVNYICINLRSQATEVYMSIVNASSKVVIMGKYQAMQTEPSKQISGKKSLYSYFFSLHLQTPPKMQRAIGYIKYSGREAKHLPATTISRPIWNRVWKHEQKSSSVILPCRVLMM